jgi:ribosome-associated protein
MMNPATETSAISKTKRKRAMEELQSLGEELVGLATSADALSSIPGVPENLRAALADARRMTRHDEARRRQMQYIGRLMRGVDADPIRSALARLQGDSVEETARLHRLEEWRRRLIDDEKAIDEIAARFPSADFKRLRSLRRAAIKEREQGKPPKNFREIFQLLKEIEQEIERKNEQGAAWEVGRGDLG